MPTDNDYEFIEDLWKAPYDQFSHRIPRPLEPSAWDCFPHSVEQMVDWAEVILDNDIQDTSRNRVLIYKTPTKVVPDTVYPVSVNIQGILKQFHLDRLGTWDGYAISINLRMCNLTFRQRPLQIAFCRPETCTRFSWCDDPHGWCARLSSEWEVMDAVPVAKINKYGTMTGLSHLLLSQGDFVEVGTEFDIILTRDVNGRSAVKIFLAFHHVIRLAAAAKLGIQSRVSIRTRS
ncbi:hypothetical protein BV22DRAFT_1024712 [Leucogyrophana mollusca]|uniref:Uncharacterized protein n=1 Tax=Leucogyrophana mollusca TaxID=85980 RepID=A0ACB8AY90_9AGAM|nr:hypothetical protein BV22DRAFT_1024712 [Leucogyrophana mollusca]